MSTDQPDGLSQIYSTRFTKIKDCTHLWQIFVTESFNRARGHFSEGRF
ncbi:MAG: hypothetical protein QOE70_6482 [Chthoniobacter sp.]|jgi:hypothetical protein|nr:hypothetical protein [Chthoniobacter sp.]